VECRLGWRVTLRSDLQATIEGYVVTAAEAGYKEACDVRTDSPIHCSEIPRRNIIKSLSSSHNIEIETMFIQTLSAIVLLVGHSIAAPAPVQSPDFNPDHCKRALINPWKSALHTDGILLPANINTAPNATLLKSRSPSPICNQVASFKYLKVGDYFLLDLPDIILIPGGVYWLSWTTNSDASIWLYSGPSPRRGGLNQRNAIEVERGWGPSNGTYRLPSSLQVLKVIIRVFSRNMPMIGEVALFQVHEPR